MVSSFVLVWDPILKNEYNGELFYLHIIGPGLTMDFGEIILIKNLVDVPRMMNFIHFRNANTTKFSFINKKVRKSDSPCVNNFNLSH